MKTNFRRNVDGPLSVSRSVMSDSLWPHGLQHTRLPCPSPPSRAWNSCALSRWCHPTISSYVIPFSSCLQSFPASRSFSSIQVFSNESVLHIRWMDLEIIILSEVSQTERQIYDITYIWNLKYGSNELISKMETDSQIYLFIFLNFILFLNFT